MCIVIIEPPQSQSVCEGGTVEFTCVVMFPNGTTPAASLWATESISDVTTALPDHNATNDLNGRSAPVNVTNVLTVTDVRINFDQIGYVCGVIVNLNFVGSNASILTVFGKYKFIVCICMHTYPYAVEVCTYIYIC